MPEALEAEVLVLGLAAGQASADSAPGLLARTAPRKCARGRDRDAIYIALALRGPQPPADSTLQECAELVADAYFGTPGSVTAALREAVQAVNAKVLELNRRAAAEGRLIEGHLLAAVIRGVDLYAARVGQSAMAVVHSHVAERFPSGGDRPSTPLGMSQPAELQYFHARVAAGELAVLSGWPAPGWQQMNYGQLAGLSLDEARLRLTQNAGGPGALLALRLDAAPAPETESRGHLSSLMSRTPLPDPVVPPLPAQPATPVSRIESTDRPSVERESAASVLGRLLAQTRTEVRAARPVQLPASAEAPYPDILPRPVLESIAAARPIEDEGPSESVDDRRTGLDREWPARWRTSLTAGMITFGRALGVTLGQGLQSLRALLARMLPEGMLQQEGLFAVPPSMGRALAVILPVAVVAVAVLAYVRLGRNEQYRTEYDQALAQVVEARLQADGALARPLWETALRHLDSAETYQQTSESFALRQEVQAALDDLDGVSRLAYRPLLLEGLGDQVSIKKLLAPDLGAVYAMDAATNAVWRFARDNDAFALDESFECMGGTVGQFVVGPLVDVTVLPPPNAINATAIVGLDPAGVVLYCAPGKPSLAAQLLPPDAGWRAPRAVEVYADRLYVLDPEANEVWQYAKVSGLFSASPSRYFSAQAYDLSDVIDFAIGNGDLYLLHADGHLTVCTREAGQDAPTCTDPAGFVDARSGRSSGATMDGAVPSAMLYDAPPEPSLYFLDSLAFDGSVVQYSLRLVFQRQYKPASPLPSRVTAIGISPDKQLVLAAGGELYAASLP